MKGRFAFTYFKGNSKSAHEALAKLEAAVLELA